MTQIQKRSSGSPDETMSGELGIIELFNFGDRAVARFVFEPGWRYSTAAEAEGYPSSCPEKHFAYQVSGVLAVRMDDGEESEIRPGEIAYIPAGHDAWVVGEDCRDGGLGGCDSNVVRPVPAMCRGLATPQPRLPKR